MTCHGHARRNRTWLVMLQKRFTGMSPEMTLSRKPGLFLSFKFTKSVRIFDLYCAVTPLLSSSTWASIAFALPRIWSFAASTLAGALVKDNGDVRAPESNANAS